MSVKMHRVMCFIVTALLILLQITCQNNIEVQFLCKNEECSEPIGEFMVKLTYRSDSPEKLSVKARETGVILARPKDRSTHLWRVKINDRIGFVPGNSIQEMKKWEANTTVKLTIPTSSVPKSDFNEIYNTSDSIKSAEERNELNDSATDSNSSVPHVEEIRNESAPIVTDDSLNEKNNADVNKKEPAPKIDLTDDQVSVPSSDESTKKHAQVDESVESKQPPATEDEQIDTLGLEKESKVVPDVSIKLENTSSDNDSDVVNIVKESEYISESTVDTIRDSAENLTQEILVEKEDMNIRLENVSDVASKVETDALVGEISNTSESISNTIEIQDDATSEVDVENTQQENLSAENTTVSNISPETEASNNLSENTPESSDKTEKDHVIVPPAEANVESNLSTPNDTSLDSSATAEVFNNSSADAEKTPDDAEPNLVPSTTPDVTSNETSPESNHDVPSVAPPMRMFPDDKEPLVSSEEPATSSEEIIIAKLDNQNITSEEINATSDFNANITEGYQQPDSVTPKEIPYDGYPPQHIETTTELGDKLPVNTEEKSDTNESVPIESPATPSSPVAEETPLSKLSEPYKYLKSSPYPGMLPNIAIENQPSVTEQSDSVSSQEIIETELEAGSDSVYQESESIFNEPASTPVEAEQKQGLNDFIHSSRVKIAEDEPEPVERLETGEEKSIYEMIGEYFPDFSILSDKLTNLFDFGSSSSEETPDTEFCKAEEFCGTDRLNSHMDKPENPESENIFQVPFVGVVNKDQVTYISGILTSAFIATILLWWMMNYFNRSKKTTQLIQRINHLESKLLISTREIASLQDKLVEQDSQAESKQNAAEIKRVTEINEHKINQYKKRIVELDDKVIYLEKELENVSNSALEMHKLLENSLATQAQSKSALDEVETLRTLAENQEIQIDELQKEINAVVTENDCLKVDNEMNKSTIKKLEKECNAQTKKNVELSEKNRSLTLLLDKELENNAVLESNYKSEIYDLRSKLEDIEMNFKRSEFQVQELQRAILDKQDNVQGSGNDVQLKVQISTLEAMNRELSGQLNEQKNARRMLEDHVGDITKELNNLKKSFENSEKEKNQAVTKLQVLTQYFKDKEEQLHKELEAKDKLSLERESKDQSLSQKLSLMREEISNLKTQNEELRKEVLDQEASYKVQLANAEQKTREHWFALRQAERKYKESQQEAAILRNKILVLETNMSSISLKTDDKNNSALNGDIPGSSSILYHPSLSPDLLPYPSPSDFIPPPPSPIPSHSPDFFPPEPIYSPDERLPPLGGRRGPSPPPPISPDDDFSPPPPVMKYPPNRNHNVEPPVPGGYSRRTPPPSGRHRSQYKSRPPRSSIDSPSSGMSLESLDKSGR